VATCSFQTRSIGGLQALAHTGRVLGRVEEVRVDVAGDRGARVPELASDEHVRLPLRDQQARAIGELATRPALVRSGAGGWHLERPGKWSAAQAGQLATRLPARA
jgi:hypothetical protein